MTVIDASPLINLGSIDHVSCLGVLPSPLRVPDAVRAEVLRPGPGGTEVPDFFATHAYLELVGDPVALHPDAHGLGSGETVVISMASTLGEIAVIDDMPARTVASSLGIPVVGTLGVLLRAKQVGVIDELRVPLAALLDQNPWLSRRLCNEVLKSAGEDSIPSE